MYHNFLLDTCKYDNDCHGSICIDGQCLCKKGRNGRWCQNTLRNTDISPHIIKKTVQKDAQQQLGTVFVNETVIESSRLTETPFAVFTHENSIFRRQFMSKFVRVELPWSVKLCSQRQLIIDDDIKLMKNVSKIFSRLKPAAAVKNYLKVKRPAVYYLVKLAIADPKLHNIVKEALLSLVKDGAIIPIIIVLMTQLPHGALRIKL